MNPTPNPHAALIAEADGVQLKGDLLMLALSVAKNESGRAALDRTKALIQRLTAALQSTESAEQPKFDAVALMDKYPQWGKHSHCREMLEEAFSMGRAAPQAGAAPAPAVAEDARDARRYRWPERLHDALQIIAANGSQSGFYLSGVARAAVDGQLGDVKLAEAFRYHYICSIECDHENKLDRVICACSTINLGWHPSVGKAVDAWHKHVMHAAIAAATPPVERP